MHKLLFALTGIFGVLALFWGFNIPRESGVSGIGTVVNLESLFFCCTFILSAVISFVGGIIIYNRNNIASADFERLISYLDYTEKKESKEQQSNLVTTNYVPSFISTPPKEPREEMKQDTKRRRSKDNDMSRSVKMVRCKNCGEYYWNTNKQCPECGAFQS